MPSSTAPVLSPKIALKPSNSGVPDSPIASAPPPTPELSSRTPMLRSSSVCMPRIVPLGTSRRGSIDSSAASGTSSIAR